MGKVSTFMERPPESKPRIRRKQMVKASMTKNIRKPVKTQEPVTAILASAPCPAPASSRALIWHDSCNRSPGPGGSEVVSDSRGTVLGGFLESCFACKKRLGPDLDIFMYRDLCAFCCTECRDSQILLDEKLEKPPMIATNKANRMCPGNCHLKLNTVKGGRMGARFGRSAAS